VSITSVQVIDGLATLYLTKSSSCSSKYEKIKCTAAKFVKTITYPIYLHLNDTTIMLLQGWPYWNWNILTYAFHLTLFACFSRPHVYCINYIQFNVKL